MRPIDLLTLLTLLSLTLAGLRGPLPTAQDHGLDPGDELPTFELTTLEGGSADKTRYAGKVLVLVYVTAEQRNSEHAIVAASDVVAELASDEVELLFVTADLVYRKSFEELWESAEIAAPLALDAERELYRALDLIVFPTTLVVGPDGTLRHLLSTSRGDYAFLLDAFVRHALGTWSDEELEAQLAERRFDEGSPRSRASRHRAAAGLLKAHGRLEAAEAELRKALELAPDDAHLALDLADLLLTAGRLDEAEVLVEAQLERDPRRLRTRTLRGILHYRRGQLEAAVAMLESALELNPDPARARYFLGLAREQQGDKDGALDQYRAALKELLGES